MNNFCLGFDSRLVISDIYFAHIFLNVISQSSSAEWITVRIEVVNWKMKTKKQKLQHRYIRTQTYDKNPPGIIKLPIIQF